MEPKHTWYARDPSIANTYDYLECVIAFSLPDPRRPQAVAEICAQTLETSGIFLVVPGEVFRFCPQSPIVRAHIKDVQHIVFKNVDARGVGGKLLDVVLAEITVFENGGKPRWTV